MSSNIPPSLPKPKINHLPTPLPKPPSSLSPHTPGSKKLPPPKPKCPPPPTKSLPATPVLNSPKSNDHLPFITSPSQIKPHQKSQAKPTLPISKPLPPSPPAKPTNLPLPTKVNDITVTNSSSLNNAAHSNDTESSEISLRKSLKDNYENNDQVKQNELPTPLNVNQSIQLSTPPITPNSKETDSKQYKRALSNLTHLRQTTTSLNSPINTDCSQSLSINVIGSPPFPSPHFLSNSNDSSPPRERACSVNSSYIEPKSTLTSSTNRTTRKSGKFNSITPRERTKRLSFKFKHEFISPRIRDKSVERYSEKIISDSSETSEINDYKEIIEETDFVRKYESFITEDDPESKIQFIPRNKNGEKVSGSELVMHTAELVHTEIMFCARLQIFQRNFEDEIKKGYPLRDYQEHLLFYPLDVLVDSITQFCLDLEPLYYQLFEKEVNEEDVVMNIISKYHVYVNGENSINLTTAYLSFISHYTSLSNVINEFIESNKSLNKLIEIQIDNCIDKNIKQFADLYFAPTQRICRYELLLSSILKEVKKDSKLEKVVNETSLCYKTMNQSINAFLSKANIYFLKRHEYLDEIYTTNKSMGSANEVRKTFNCPTKFISYHEGYKGDLIGSAKIELCIFEDGVFKKDSKKGFFDFYPINSLYKDPSKKEQDVITENDVYFYDIKKKKTQIITMETAEEREQFNNNLKVTHDNYLKSLSKK